MLSGTRGIYDHGEYSVDIDVTRLNRGILAIDVWTMPCKPRHLEDTIERPAEVDDLEVITACKPTKLVGNDNRPLLVSLRLAIGVFNDHISWRLADTQPREEDLQTFRADNILSRPSPAMLGEGALHCRRAR